MEEYLDEADDPPKIGWRFYDLQGYKRDPDGEIAHDIEDGKDDDYFAQDRKNVKRLKDGYDVEMTLDHSLNIDS